MWLNLCARINFDVKLKIKSIVIFDHVIDMMGHCKYLSFLVISFFSLLFLLQVILSTSSHFLSSSSRYYHDIGTFHPHTRLSLDIYCFTRSSSFIFVLYAFILTNFITNLLIAYQLYMKLNYCGNRRERKKLWRRVEIK